MQEENLISWPNEARALQIAVAFESTYSFPGTTGCIDGTEIRIKAPTWCPSSYINRKGHHSVTLQAVCDNEMRFIDCYAGEAGSVHDAAVFRRAPLSLEMRKEGVFPGGTHILGDAAYPLQSNLLVPYKDNGHLAEHQVLYNAIRSSTRCTISEPLPN
ncbi:putative nuclease HARBI1 [Ornithodoros turicata]|uniref:putative nuclease HARBI1 n=1 Tax=Ornithodoros turicata TaxID=34597 RepID=UPI00313A3F55